MTASVLGQARELADNILFPAALDVDSGAISPSANLDALAEAGFYGLAGGDANTTWLVTEILASGCLTTAFVWRQHIGLLTRVVAAGGRAELVRELRSGARRGGVALGGTLPGAPRLRARETSGGYVISGESPWVTGWGLIDLLLVAARDEQDRIVWGLVDARESAGLRVSPTQLVATQASGTITAHFDGLYLDTEALIGRQNYAEWAEQDAAGLRTNGSLALGVINRCARLIGPSPLDAELTACRERLDAAGPDDAPAARAAASELAVRAGAALVVHTGSRSILADSHAQRLAREALFLLVFASRKGIRAALLDSLL